jgi:hypothetical protein
MGIKNEEFDDDIESVHKVKKNNTEKVINEKVTEKWIFWLLLLCAEVFGLQVFGVILFAFFNEFQLTSIFCVFYETFIELFKKIGAYISPFDNFKSQNGQNGKKTKNVF